MVDVWSLKPPSQVLLEEIDDFLFCYSLLRGETHILDAFPSEIVRQLVSGPKSREQIKDCLAVVMGESPENWASSIDGVLRELEHRHLVQLQMP